jgi:hypothetical protein
MIYTSVSFVGSTALADELMLLGKKYFPGIPQTFSISVIAFTGKKFRSHWPSVTPSALVLVRFPLHVILSVEAAFPSAIVPKMSKRMHRTVMRVNIATTKAKR